MASLDDALATLTAMVGAAKASTMEPVAAMIQGLDPDDRDVVLLLAVANLRRNEDAAAESLNAAMNLLATVGR